MISVLVPSAAFAQFAKSPLHAARNRANLERALKKATLAPRTSLTVTVSPTLVPGGRVQLTPVHLPKITTPANDTYVRMVRPLVGWFRDIGLSKPEVERVVATSWKNIPGEFAPGAKAFYQDQSTLARDLDRFYSGQGSVFIGPGGKKVKLYVLPVNGILYQPAGYKEPVVLNAKDYFVMYDMQSKTGQLMECEPGRYRMFKPYVTYRRR